MIVKNPRTVRHEGDRFPRLTIRNCGAPYNDKVRYTVPYSSFRSFFVTVMLQLVFPQALIEPSEFDSAECYRTLATWRRSISCTVQCL